MVNNSFIVLIFGASGSGKSTLMDLLLCSGSQYSVQMKGTDRPPRQYDGVEIICDSEFDKPPGKYDYIYHTYGHRYGIQRKQIDEAIQKKQHHFIICNSIPTINSIKRDYGELVKVVFHYFYAPRQEILRIQQKRGISDDEVNLRLAKINILYRQFVENYQLFDAALPNYFKEDPNALLFRMEKILSEFASNARNSQPSVEVMEKLNTLAKEFEKKLPSNSREKTQNVDVGYVFIIMAIRENDAENEDLHHTIKRVCAELGFKADRVDDIEYTGTITEKIQGCIEIAEFIIADISHERPNVYYEIGYADAFNKPLILIAKQGVKLHFDIQGKKVLFYKGFYQLESLLKKTLEELTNRKHKS